MVYINNGIAVKMIIHHNEKQDWEKLSMRENKKKRTFEKYFLLSIKLEKKAKPFWNGKAHIRFSKNTYKVYSKVHLQLIDNIFSSELLFCRKSRFRIKYYFPLFLKFYCLSFDFSNFLSFFVCVWKFHFSVDALFHWERKRKLLRN